jgi:asparagine synthase (glutamine-hydrolysing)
MQSVSARPVKTFTIGFSEAAYNEAEYAKVVARHLGTDHTELYLSPTEAMEVIPTLPEMYDEPFADPSQIPTHLISRLARRHVTVALSGDGGDELFGGYNRYSAVPRIWNRIRRVPRSWRSAAANALTRLSPRTLQLLTHRFDRLLPRGTVQMRLDEKIGKLAGLLRSEDLPDVYRALVSVWPSPSGLALGGVEHIPALETAAPHFDNVTARMMYLDLVTYLPDDILVKVDRAAMRVGLETRVPFLDHRVVEFAWRIPTETHLNGGLGKQVVRCLLSRYVPRSLIERPKMGFGVPVGEWIRGPLRNWAEDLLDESRLASDGFFAPRPIRETWREHLLGTADRTDQLWGILMFQSWLASSTAVVAA